MAIFFQGNSGEFGGVSGCDVYSYGFTSGCTDDLGVQRGFTQEWYYDSNLSAWISVSQAGATGADFENAGETYDTFTHELQDFDGEGQIKKYAYLDPTTGALTFDYINTFDIVNPNERLFRFTDFDWLGVQSGQAGLVSGGTNFAQNTIDGVTLCSNGAVIQEISTNEGSVGIRAQFNGSSPSDFSVAPETLVVSVLGSVDVTILGSSDGDGSPAADFPITLTADSSLGTDLVNGNTNIPRNIAYIGFTTNGPVYRGIRISAGATGANGTTLSNVAPQRVSTENNYYVALVPSEIDLASVTAGTITDRALAGGTGGDKFLVTPVNNPLTSPNTKIKRTISREDFGGDGNLNDFFTHFAFPLRCQIDAGNHLFAEPGANDEQPAFGFENNEVFAKRLNITNEYNYTEEYIIFRAQQPGVSENGIKVDTTV